MASPDLSSVILGTYGVIKPPPPAPVEERWWWQRVHHRKTGKHEKKFWWHQSTLNRRWLNGLEPPLRPRGPQKGDVGTKSPGEELAVDAPTAVASAAATRRNSPPLEAASLQSSSHGASA